MFTRALHLSLSWATSIQSVPLRSISLWSILILSSYLLLGLPSGLLLYGFPTKTLYAFSVTSMHATCPVHLILLDLIILILHGEHYKLWISLICSFSSTSNYFICLLSKYSPQHPFFKYL
jgi:hypothetical protein